MKLITYLKTEPTSSELVFLLVFFLIGCPLLVVTFGVNGYTVLSMFVVLGSGWLKCARNYPIWLHFGKTKKEWDDGNTAVKGNKTDDTAN